MTKLCKLLIWFLAIFAGGYNLFARSYRGFGGVGGGTLTFLGILIAYPACVVISILAGGGREVAYGVVVLWFVMLAAAYVSAFARWISESPPIDEGERCSWAGRNEPLAAMALIGVSGCTLGSGVGLFFALGFAASQLTVELVRIVRRVEGWTPEDDARVREARASRARIVRAGLGKFAAFARARLAKTSVEPAHAPSEVGGLPVVPNQHFAALPYPPAYVGYPPHYGYGPPPRRQTFMGRVSSIIVAHFVISLLTGVIGLGTLTIVAVRIAALPLQALGVHMKFPTWMTEGVGAAVDKTKAVVGDKSRALKSRFHRDKGEPVNGAEDEEDREEDEGEAARPPTPIPIAPSMTGVPVETVTTLTPDGRVYQQEIVRHEIPHITSPEQAQVENLRTIQRQREMGHQLLKDAEATVKRKVRGKVLDYYNPFK